MGIFWEIDERLRRIRALEERVLYFPKEKEYCLEEIKKLEKELEKLYNKLKNG